MGEKGRKRGTKKRTKGGELIEAHLEQVYSDSLLMFGFSVAKLTLASHPVSPILPSCRSAFLYTLLLTPSLLLWTPSGCMFGLLVIAEHLDR